MHGRSGGATSRFAHVQLPGCRMKLATFTYQKRTSIGAVVDGAVVDFSADPKLPRDMVAFLESGPGAFEVAHDVISRARTRLPLADVRLEAPVPRPRKFLGLGFAYASHVAEVAHLGIKPPPHQTWFNKQVTCVNGPYDPIHLPRVSPTLDYEGELALVIGRRCRHARPDDARSIVAGFMICNDVSVREWQLRASTAMIGKSFDTHGPIGPWICTTDELPDVHSLSLRTWVNGELRQDGNTSDLVYRFGDMIAELSTAFTLEPGDILTTGSPAGVGAARQPPSYLKVGDVCRIEIERIGHIENVVIAEP
jgi:2-keto-4-pentenoate hydratase/2-oxohepta-3-ene-1,7-dioic acid hydratase in catechol pathway